MRYLEQPPPPPLAPFVECLWTAWDPRLRRGRGSERIVPDGCPELIFHLADPFSRRVDGRWVRQPRAFLAGTLTRPWTLRPGPAVRCFGVRFRPGAMRRFLPVEPRAARDRETPLLDLLGETAARSLWRALVAARSAPRRFALLREGLRGRLGDDPAPSRAAAAVDRIRASGGRVRVEDLAATLGTTRRRLERLFLAELGIPPKQFARLMRFQAALAAVGRGGRESLVDLALEHGYFDQSHLLAEARALAGRKVQADRRFDGELARHFTDPARIRALLAAP
jgi:AraC-like DNA-binding protein